MKDGEDILSKFLLDVHKLGVDITPTRRAVLYKKGLLTLDDVGGSRYKRDVLNREKQKREHVIEDVFTTPTKETKRADSYVEVIRKDSGGEHKIEPAQKITKEDWCPETDQLKNHAPEFIKWIDSINNNFDARIRYDPFELYCRQAEQWLEEKKFFEDFHHEHSRYEFAKEELMRMRDNSYYFLEKYTYYKDSDPKTGGAGFKYHASPANKITAFLMDCGYSLMIGKARQIWLTTTISGICMKRANLHKQYFVKYICENLTKGNEIFDDKFKFSFYELPEWMKSTVHNDQERMFRFLYKSPSTKGNVLGTDSKLLVEAPYVTAINGGSPSLVALDEIGQIPLLGRIIQEGRPTLFKYDPLTKKLIQVRQLVSFGTGGESERGGREFEIQFTSLLALWAKRNFETGIVPVFFSAFARQGFTMDMYNKEKDIAYSKNDEREKVSFHQHYPLGIEDMFLSSKPTIIPLPEIQSQINRIDNTEKKIIRGNFIPKYDLSQKFDQNSYIPYKIIGAEFIGANDGEYASALMWDEPDLSWVNRYYQGTDPTNSVGGQSLFSSAIWDSYYNLVPCVINTRTNDYRADYLQSVLMNIYYGLPPHLIEINIGKEMVNFIDQLGYYRTLMPKSMLPPPLQTATSETIGIDKKSSTSDKIINRLFDILDAYRGNINIRDFWVQLKTFVKKDGSSTLQTGEIKSVWKTENAKYWHDDLIFAIIYSYIASECHNRYQPTQKDQQRKKKVMRWMCNQQTNWETALVEVVA